MLALLRWLIGFASLCAVLVFAVLNRDTISLYYTPVHDPIQLPLYMVGLGMLAFGYIFGALTIWFADSKIRAERRKQRKEIKSLNAELDKTMPKRHDKIFNDEELKQLLPALPSPQKS